MAKKTPRINYNLSLKEIESVISLNAEKRYLYTLKRIADFEIMWTIDFFHTRNFNIINTKSIPIWPFKEYAGLYSDEISFIPITLDVFVNKVIDIICHNNLLLNVFPTKEEPLGKQIDINTFANDLRVVLCDYD